MSHNYSPILLLLLLCYMLPGTQMLAQQADTLLLKNFRPVSIYRLPITQPQRARFPVVDFHTHDYPKDQAAIARWIQTMDAANVSKSIILSYTTGTAFDSVVARYAPYGDRFEVWCGIDYTNADKPGWPQRAVAELERCYRAGARGVGELGDKGLGELYSQPTPGYGIHINDPRMRPVLEKCAELKMPVSIHVAEDAWMYHPPDSTNDGLMNAAKWQVDMRKPGILDHTQLIGTLEAAVRDHPGTTFIACHLANSCADLTVLEKLLDRYLNLYADIAARYGEISPTPRRTKAFLEKYSDRIVYGTDMGTSADMYRVTFRILETADEHFYEHDRFGYHWPLHGLNLSDAALQKIYNGNGQRILQVR